MKISNVFDGLVDKITGDKGFSIENASSLLENGAFRRAAAAQMGVTPASLLRATPQYLQEHAGELRSAWRGLEKDRETAVKPVLAKIEAREKAAAHAHYVNSGQQRLDRQRSNDNWFKAAVIAFLIFD